MLCENCGNKFSSYTGKTHCQKCRNALGLVNSQALRARIQKRIKQTAEDPMLYADEIKRLAVKIKWNLLSHIDMFRVVHIYLNITNDPEKYSSDTPEIQAQLMIKELIRMITLPKKKPGRPSMSVCLIEGDRVVKTWKSTTECANELGMRSTSVTKICNGGRVKGRKMMLVWKSDLKNI